MTTLTIAQGQQASSAVFLRGPGFNRVWSPAGIEGATLTFQCARGDFAVAPVDADYRDMKDSAGNPLTVPADPTAAVSVIPDLLGGIGWFRLRAASAQAQAREIVLLYPVAR